VADPARILIRMPTWVGDAVMATAALRAVRRSQPDAHVALMGASHLEPLLDDASLFDEWVSTSSGTGKVSENVSSISTFGADVGLVFPHSFRTAWELWRGGVPRRIGFARQGRGWLLTDPLLPHRLPPGRRAIPMHHEYLEVVAPLGASGDGQGSILGVSDQVAASASARLSALSVRSDRRWVGFHPGAAFGPSKIWPLDRMADVARTLRDQDGCGLLITCGPGEEALASELRGLIGGDVVDLSEDLWPLDQLKYLMGQLALLVTGDTGPRHIAAGMGTPQVVLMGPTSPDYTDAHLEITSVIRREDVDCSPCQMKVCPLEHHRCMTLIEPQQVIDEARHWLQRESR